MKANEFVKKFGLGTVKWILGDRKFAAPRTIHLEPHEIEFTPGDLKRLVESHELVEKCGGIESLKSWLNYEKRKIDLSVYVHCNKPPVLLNIETAEKAIADVESCMEVPSESN